MARLGVLGEDAPSPGGLSPWVIPAEPEVGRFRCVIATFATVLF